MFHNKNYIYMLLVSLVLLLALVSCGDATNFPSETTAPEPTADVIATVLPDILTTQSTSPTSTLVATQGISAVATGTPTPTLESTTAATSSATELISKPTQTAKPTEAPTAKPTPTAPSILNAGNGNTNFTETKTVVFSHPSGFYGSKFTLKLGGDSKYTIRYTTNGNEPVSTSKKYSDAEGIKITDKGSMIGAEDKVTVVRAAAFMGTTKVGETVTATYIVNEDYKNFKDYYANIAVVSITTDKKNLYGDTGIFTNYTEHGRQTERPAHVEFFDSDGTAGFSVDAGMRVYGGTSRGAPQKSLKLVARKEYDPENGKFKYAMLPDSVNSEGVVVDRFDSFILRAGGNDNLFGSSRNTLLRDALVHMLAGKMGNIAFQAYRPVVVYINGMYWGLYNLRDDTDNDYIEQHYGIPKDNVAIIAYGHENGEWFYKIDEGTEADLESYKYMLSYIANTDMAISANYASACQKLDMDNFMKYIAVNVFANNRDWPHNNVRAWMHEGKWRFVLKDIDYSWGIYDLPGQTENVIAEEIAHSENVLRGRAGEISAAFASLMKNKTFKTQFLALVDEMVNNYFSAKTSKALIDDMVARMSPEFPRLETNIWYANPDNPADGQNSISQTYERWLKGIDTLYDYAKKRPDVFKKLVYRIYG